MWFSWGFPGGSNGKESACSAGNPGSIPGLGRSPGEGNGNPLQYPCLENSLDRGAWRATVQRVITYSILLGRRRNQWWTCGLRNGFWEGVAGVLSSNLRGLTPGNAEEPRNVQNHLRPWWLGGAPTTGPSRTKAVISPAARSWSHRAEVVCLPPGSCHLRTGWRDHTGTSSVDPPHLQSLCCRGLLISFSPICSLCSPSRPNPLPTDVAPKSAPHNLPTCKSPSQKLFAGNLMQSKMYTSEPSGTLDSLRGSHGHCGLAWETMGMSLYTLGKGHTTDF